MHIPDGFLDAKTWITLSAVSTVVVGVALNKKETKQLDQKQVPVIGMMTAFIFAAQMINFPIAGATSGHLLGGALAAILFGPWLGSIMMTAIFMIQAFFFQDGGITALGANIFNAVAAGFVGYWIYTCLKKVSEGKLQSMAVFIASFISVIVAAVLIAIELAISGTVPFMLVLKAMVSWHIVIGIAEGVITVFVLKTVLANQLIASKLANERSVS